MWMMNEYEFLSRDNLWHMYLKSSCKKCVQNEMCKMLKIGVSVMTEVIE